MKVKEVNLKILLFGDLEFLVMILNISIEFVMIFKVRFICFISKLRVLSFY